MLNPKIFFGLAGTCTYKSEKILFSHYHMKVLHLLMNRLMLKELLGSAVCGGTARAVRTQPMR